MTLLNTEYPFQHDDDDDDDDNNDDIGTRLYERPPAVRSNK